MFSRLLTKLKQVLTWGVYSTIPEDDLLEKQRFKLFFTFTATCFLLCFAESFHALSMANSILATGLITFAIIFVANYLSLQWHRNLRMAYLICLMTAFACVHLFNYYYGGIRNSGNFYFLFMIIATVILLGNRQGWIMLGLSVVNQIYFYFISDNPNLVTNVMATSESSLNQDFVFSYGLAVVAIAALSNSLGSSKNIVIEKITESRRVLADKNRELSKLSLVASKTDSAVAITDQFFLIRWVNDGFTRLTGYSQEEVKGHDPDTFVKQPDNDPEFLNRIKKELAEGRTYTGEMEEKHHDGHTYWTRVTATPICAEDGSLQKVIYLKNDITQRKIAENKIKAYLHNLEMTNKELDEFAYVVSHDLKAPLHAISNLTTWIEEDMEGKFSEETNSNFNIIKSRVSRMEDLINGLLEFARANHKKGEKSLVDLNEHINQILEMCAIPANCTIAIPGKLPVLFGDKIKFQQIFSNLISNAVKYCDKEEIHITISAEEREDEWVMSVKDNGPGIDPRFHDKVFVIFQTLNPRDTVESTGVGLAIVKKVVEEEGGSVWIESEPGKGANFLFTWLKEHKQGMFRNRESVLHPNNSSE